MYSVRNTSYRFCPQISMRTHWIWNFAKMKISKIERIKLWIRFNYNFYLSTKKISKEKHKSRISFTKSICNFNAWLAFFFFFLFEKRERKSYFNSNDDSKQCLVSVIAWHFSLALDRLLFLILKKHVWHITLIMFDTECQLWCQH